MPNFDAISTTVVLRVLTVHVSQGRLLCSLSETLLCFIVEYLEPDSNIPVTNGLTHF